MCSAILSRCQCVRVHVSVCLFELQNARVMERKKSYQCYFCTSKDTHAYMHGDYMLCVFLQVDTAITSSKYTHNQQTRQQQIQPNASYYICNLMFFNSVAALAIYPSGSGGSDQKTPPPGAFGEENFIARLPVGYARNEIRANRDTLYELQLVF